LKLLLSLKFILFLFVIGYIALLQVSIASSQSDRHLPITGLRGPAFSDPFSVQQMPADWEKQSITYDSEAGKADIVITLDQHLYPALLPQIQEYAKEFDKKIVVGEGTCGISAGMLSRKMVDIGGFCCPPGSTDRLPGLSFHTLGISAIAVIVHPDNPIDNITIKEAQQVFTGDIERWSQLKADNGSKGPSMPIQPIGRLHCKLRPGHWRLLLDNQDMFSTSMLEVGSIPDMIHKVALNRNAIGYETLWNLTRYKEKRKVKVLRINGYSPYNQKNVVSGSYPLYRVYNLSTWEGNHVASPDAQKLVEYLFERNERIGESHHIIPVSQLKKAGWKFKDTELIGDPG